MDAEVHTRPGRTPFPKWQLTIVYAIQLAEPFAATVIYPYLPELIARMLDSDGARDQSRVGYYAGSVFFAAECLSVFLWSRASDLYGRRPVLLWGPLGLALSLLGFGLSSNFWWLVIFRAFQGIFNGNIGVSKTVLAEMTDSTNIGDAFAIMPIMWQCHWESDQVSSPIIGGFLADPAQRWPEILRKMTIFVVYPYLLPCAIAASFSFVVYLCALYSLQETHPLVLEKRKIILDERTGLLDSDSNGVESASPQIQIETPGVGEFFNKNLMLTVINYCALAFLSMGSTVLMPLMFSTSIEVGGLGFSPFEIGLILGVWGLLNATLQILFMGRVLRRFGERPVFISSMLAIFLASCAFAFESFFARRAGRVDALVWTLLCLQLICNFMLSASYGTFVQSATSRRTLGATNGFAQMAASGIRGLSPSLASSLFSATLEYHLAGGFLVYIVMSSLALLAFSFMIPKNMKAP
ncbi:major facilitator superfamily domain-containing protein [Mucidula mucida]|nr:major facilitator superfamily domain-containing protein [Mucidula mucida]